MRNAWPISKRLFSREIFKNLILFLTFFNYFYSGRLLTLLNLLCNQTQNTSISVRDACYGCFFRIANLPGGQTMLTELSNCANLYLRNTTYNGCAIQLAVSFFNVENWVRNGRGK
jgi:hypothetical protein